MWAGRSLIFIASWMWVRLRTGQSAGSAAGSAGPQKRCVACRDGPNHQTVERSIDRLVRQMAPGLVRKPVFKGAANRLGTPSPCEPFDHEVVKFPVCHELRQPRPCNPP